MGDTQQDWQTRAKDTDEEKGPMASQRKSQTLITGTTKDLLEQCFSTPGQRHGTGTWHQLYRAARGSPGSCHFSLISIFHE
jgi:hypothetical protein